MDVATSQAICDNFSRVHTQDKKKWSEETEYQVELHIEKMKSHGRLLQYSIEWLNWISSLPDCEYKGNLLRDALEPMREQVNKIANGEYL